MKNPEIKITITRGKSIWIATGTLNGKYKTSAHDVTRLAAVDNFLRALDLATKQKGKLKSLIEPAEMFIDEDGEPKIR
jgi:ribosomal protein S13